MRNEASASRSGAAIICIDGKRRVVSANRAAEGMFSLKAGELKGRSIEKLLSGIRFKGNEPLPLQRLPLLAGATPVQVSSTVLRIRGALFRVLVLTHFRARQSARQDQKLSALIAHDLRAALGAVALAMDVLRSTHSAAGDNYSRTAQEAAAALRFMDQLVEDLVQTSQTDDKTLSLNKRTMNPRALLDLALESVRPLVRHKALGVHCPEKLPSVHADPHRFTQVLANLLNNAARASDPNADISIRVRRARNEICFCVVDGGPGLPASAIEMLSGRAPSTSPQTRRGLGLSIARSIVEAHSGRIWADTIPGGGGGRVSFTLPVSSRRN